VEVIDMQTDSSCFSGWSSNSDKHFESSGGPMGSLKNRNEGNSVSLPRGEIGRKAAYVRCSEEKSSAKANHDAERPSLRPLTFIEDYKLEHCRSGERDYSVGTVGSF